MTSWTSFLGLLMLTCGIVGAPVSLCPKQCSCTISEKSVGARCHSFEFLKKSLLSPEQMNAIVTLDISGGPTIKTNPDLSHLRNLKQLSLTSIKIQQIIAAHFPKLLEYLDLSGNSIKQPPEDLHLLSALKEVNLFGNPLSCNCNSLAVRDALLEKGVIITKPIKCESPDNVRGKLWLTAVCKNPTIENLFGEMQGDEPYEGSGSGDIDLQTDTEPTEKAHAWDTIEEEFIPVKIHSNVGATPPQEPATEAPELEGSGDEPEMTALPIIPELNQQEITTVAADYDEEEDEDLEDLYTDAPPVNEPPVTTEDMLFSEKNHVRACAFNCSTPAPLAESNETEAAPPNFFEGIKIVVNDFGILGQPETTTTTTTTTTEQPISPVVVVPEGKERAINIEKNKTSTDTEVFKHDLKTGKDKENIENSKQAQQTQSTFIFLGVLFLLIVCLVIYAFVKRRAQNRGRPIPRHISQEKEQIPEEMELIKKVAPENDKQNGTHEAIPLMNGHNEKQKNAEDDLLPDANDMSKPGDEGEDVDLRPKRAEQKNLLTPEAKRVTIKASEIPNSTPKTPILVTRHVNSDGSIVTTPSIDQNV